MPHAHPDEHDSESQRLADAREEEFTATVDAATVALATALASDDHWNHPTFRHRWAHARDVITEAATDDPARLEGLVETHAAVLAEPYTPSATAGRAVIARIFAQALAAAAHADRHHHASASGQQHTAAWRDKVARNALANAGDRPHFVGDVTAARTHRLHGDANYEAAAQAIVRMGTGRCTECGRAFIPTRQHKRVYVLCDGHGANPPGGAHPAPSPGTTRIDLLDQITKARMREFLRTTRA